MTAVLDVAIVGGGPAGCATAIALHQLGIDKLCVVESSDYSTLRVGESIPPDTGLLLRRLGLWQRFIEQRHAHCLGSCSSWGADELGYNDFLVNPHGTGWHLDRLRFDRWLADEVEERDIELRQQSSLQSVQQGDSQRPIELTVNKPGHQRETLRCRFVVDASGRSARLARRLGARRHVEDQLVCVAAYLDTPTGQGLNSLTLLEAVEHGWWYAARLPDGRVTAAVASDAEIIRERGLTRIDQWRRELPQTRHIGAALAGYQVTNNRLHLWVAPSMLLDPPSGPGWLAVGDAASSYDPISSQGIYKALLDGLTSAPAIIRWLDGDPRGIVEYRKDVGARFLDYLRQRDYFYDRERRWENAPFWRKRHSSTSADHSIHPKAARLDPLAR